MGKFEAHENPEGFREIAKAREALGLSLEIGVRQLGDYIGCTELDRGIELGSEVFRLELLVHPKEFDIEYVKTCIVEPGLRLPHQNAISREIVERFLGGDPSHPKARMAIALAFGDLDHLRRRERQHRQVGERVVVFHRAS